MKFLSRTSKPVLILWLCLLTLVDFKSFPNFVLCFGEDGHIELEAAVQNRCANETQLTLPDFLALSPADEEHCGECSDIPLISNLVQTAHKTVTVSSSGSDFSRDFPRLHSFPYVSRQVVKPQFLPPPSQSLILISICSVRLLV